MLSLGPAFPSQAEPITEPIKPAAADDEWGASPAAEQVDADAWDAPAAEAGGRVSNRSPLSS